jgi:hypothetical protein
VERGAPPLGARRSATCPRRLAVELALDRLLDRARTPLTGFLPLRPYLPHKQYGICSGFARAAPRERKRGQQTSDFRAAFRAHSDNATLPICRHFERRERRDSNPRLSPHRDPGVVGARLSLRPPDDASGGMEAHHACGLAMRRRIPKTRAQSSILVGGVLPTWPSDFGSTMRVTGVSDVANARRVRARVRARSCRPDRQQIARAAGPRQTDHPSLTVPRGWRDAQVVLSGIRASSAALLPRS